MDRGIQLLNDALLREGAEVEAPPPLPAPAQEPPQDLSDAENIPSKLRGQKRGRATYI